MTTVSAVARLMPRPPALVDSKKANCWAPGAERRRRDETVTLNPQLVALKSLEKLQISGQDK